MICNIVLKKQTDNRANGFHVTNLAALASEFLALGAFGSETNDLAAKRSLLDAVDVFFKLRTKESLAASS